ncbi:MAG: winged helix-turn-helix domain-containing protein [Burkholderiales bacterium]|nr:winged helix-turn-helix domain-containing protein [Burkholderiales bacterium]
MRGRCFAFGPFLLDAGRGVLLRDGAAVALGNRAFLVLQALVAAQGQVVTKSELMAAGWPQTVVEESNLSVQIAALRKLLGPPPDGVEWIATVARIGYRFDGAATVGEEVVTAAPAAPEHDAARKPSIAVLPFTNLSRDQEQEYFADGITEDIITALARYRWFFVIARNSSFAYKGKAVDARQVAHELGVGYVLEGSVRNAHGQVRISAQLVDAASGNQLWADRYDFALVEMFAVQDQIAEQVVGAIEPALLKTESDHSPFRRDGRNITGWDLVRRGAFCFHQVTREGHLRARDLFREACATDPDLPDGYFWLARACSGLIAYGWSDDIDADLKEGMAAAVRAVHLEEQNPYSHYGLAGIYIFAGDFAQAIRAAERAIELSPSFALGYFVLGLAYLCSGQPASAIEPLRHGFRLNPYDPQNFVWYNQLALAHFFAGEPEEALLCTVKAAQIRPTWLPTYQKMACCHLVLGHADEARDCLQKLASLEKAPGDNLAPFKRHQPQWIEEMKNLLRDAGVKESDNL